MIVDMYIPFPTVLHRQDSRTVRKRDTKTPVPTVDRLPDNWTKNLNKCKLMPSWLIVKEKAVFNWVS